MIKYIKIAYKFLVPNGAVRISLAFSLLFALPFMTIGTISSLYPTLGLKQKFLFTLVIWLAILLIITIWAFIRAMVVLFGRKDPPEENHKYLQELDAKFYGISRKLLIIESELLSDGSLKSKVSIQLTAATDKVYSIEHNMTAPHAPESDAKINLEAEEVFSDKIKLKPVILIAGNRRLFWKLNFLPCLPRGEFVKYSYTEKTPLNSFAMNCDELKTRKMDFESCSMKMTYPTEYFKYKMVFPQDFDPNMYDYDVWLGEGRVQHMDEYRRIHPFWKVGRNDDGRMFIELSVKNPIHGLIYALKWTPSS